MAVEQGRMKTAPSLVPSSLNAKERTESPCCLNHLPLPESVTVAPGIVSLRDTPLSFGDITCLLGPLKVEFSCFPGEKGRTNRWKKKMFSGKQSKLFALSA